MIYFPKYRIIRSLLVTLVLAIIPTIIIYILFKPFLVNFSFIYTLICIFTILLVVVFYINFQIFYVKLDNETIIIKYFFHRPESTLKIDLNEIEKIRLTTTIKQDRFFEIKTRKGTSIDINLNAIPLTKLYEIANEHGIEINNENIVD